MNVRTTVIATLAAMLLLAVEGAAAQGSAKQMSVDEVKTLLIWNSPWEGSAAAPPQLYSFRTVFRQRRESLIAEVTSYSTNQRGDSVVNITDGSVNWLDSSGAEVNVAVAASGQLVGTAKSQGTQVSIVLKPRP